MSTPRTLAMSELIRREDCTTSRGVFATLRCTPQGTSLPRGNVLLISGFTGSKEDFAALLPLLADAGWSAATYDQRGQFETSASAGDDLTLAGFAADAVQVARSLYGVEERVHLVGHSFGGLVAAEAVLSSPRTWASMSLLCSGPGAFTGAKRQELLDAADVVSQQGLEAGYQLRLQREREQGTAEAPGPVEEFLHQRFLSNSAESLTAIARMLAHSPDRTSDLGAVDVPVAVLRGATDEAWPHATQDAMARAVGTRVVVIDDAGHSPAVEAPEATRDALVRSWLG